MARINPRTALYRHLRSHLESSPVPALYDLANFDDAVVSASRGLLNDGIRTVIAELEHSHSVSAETLDEQLDSQPDGRELLAQIDRITDARRLRLAMKASQATSGAMLYSLTRQSFMRTLLARRIDEVAVVDGEDLQPFGGAAERIICRLPSVQSDRGLCG